MKVTVLVIYKKWRKASHVMLEGYWETKSKVVKVSDLVQLNKMFGSKISKIQVLECKKNNKL